MLVTLAIFGCSDGAPSVLDTAELDPVDSATPSDTDDPDHTDDPLPPTTLKVVGWNLESGDSQLSTLVEQLRAVEGEAIWGLSEVSEETWAEALAEVADDEGDPWSYVLGTTGGADRLAILYDPEVVALRSSEELDDINVGGTVRAPLVAHFRLKGSGEELLFMVNHLWRTFEEGRHQQAELLNTWGAEQVLPVVAVGDYNFDWAVEGGEDDHDAGYDRMTADGVWTWVRPLELVETQCSSYDGVLDFTFVTEPALAWGGRSTILHTEEGADCTDDDRSSDHRPVDAVFGISSDRGSTPGG